MINKIHLIILIILSTSYISFTQNKPKLIIQENHTNEIYHIAQHPTKNIVATADVNTVKIWDNNFWQLLHTISFSEELDSNQMILNLQFAKDNQLIVTTVEYYDDSKLTMDLETDFIPLQYKSREKPPLSEIENSLQYSERELAKFLARDNVKLGKRKTFLVDFVTGQKIETPYANFIIKKKNGEPLLITQPVDSSIFLTFQSESELVHLPFPLEILHLSFVRFTDDFELLICGYTDGLIEFRTPTTFQKLFDIPTNLEQILAIHQIGDSLICEGTRWNDNLAIIDLNQRKLANSIELSPTYLDDEEEDFLLLLNPLVRTTTHHFGIDLDVASGWMAIGLQYNRIYFWNLFTGERKNLVNCPLSTINSLTFSNDGKELIIVGSNPENSINKNPVLTYNLSTNKFLEKPHVGFDEAIEIGWTKDGTSFYILSNTAFSKWSIKNLRKEKEHLIKRTSNLGFSKFIKGINDSYIERPPFYNLGHKQYYISNGIIGYNHPYPSSIGGEADLETKAIIPDRCFLIYSYKTQEYFVQSQHNGKRLYAFHLEDETNFKISNDGNWLAYFQEDHPTLRVVNTNSWEEVFSFGIDLEVGSYFRLKDNFDFSKDSQLFTFFQDRSSLPEENEISPPSLHHIQVYELDTLTLSFHLKHQFKYDAPINLVRFGYAPETILVGTIDVSLAIEMWNTVTGQKMKKFSGHSRQIELIADHENYLFSKSADNTYRIWDKNTTEELLKILNYSNGVGREELILNKDNYYMASKDGVNLVGYQLEDRGYPFQQFDLQQNRPDKVLASLPNANKQLVNAYYRAYEKRLSNLGLTSQITEDEFHIPHLDVFLINEENPTNKETIKLKVLAADSVKLLDRINVWVNGVPIFGKKGDSIKKQKTHAYEKEYTIPLNEGENNIQVAAMNIAGLSSLKETFSVTKEKTTKQNDLYLIAIGAAKYQDSTFNLDFPTVDMDSLINIFQLKQSDYRNIHITKYYNESVSLNDLQHIKKQLANSKVDDKVILAYAGHGLIDEKLDYYLASYDVDFKEPAKKGISVTALENLLDGIPAREKLLLLDACHSGEIDKAYLQKVKAENDKAKDIKFRAVTNSTFSYTHLGINNSFELMRTLFIDLRDNTGTTIISSAGGIELALESKKWKNGAFIAALDKGLRQRLADQDRDGEIMVSELKTYLAKEVFQLTNGLQQPTTRLENISYDWVVW